MRIEITSRWAAVLLAFGLALTLTGGYSWAASRSTAAQSTITACAKKTGGALRLLGSAKACGTDESLVSWSQTGPAGPAGPAGATGPAGISGLQVVQYGSGFGNHPAVSVACPGGKKVIGGGFDTEVSGHPGIKMPRGYINQNLPDATGRQWVVQGSDLPSDVEWKVQGYAICATVQG